MASSTIHPHLCQLCVSERALPCLFAPNVPNQFRDGFHIHPFWFIRIKIINALLPTVIPRDVILWNIDSQRLDAFTGTGTNLLGGYLSLS